MAAIPSRIRCMKLLRSSLASALLLLLSCSTGTQAYAERQRAVAHPSRTPATPSVVQWQHDWADGAVFYEIFVRSFADSNGDGIGDLQGLISRLDYLNDGNPATTTDLGIEGIWLMPVFQSPSYHGYDTVDYETIEEDYGTNADFQQLLDEAHRRGIRVIVDFVVNHTSNQHPWFVESSSSPASPKRDWYVWSPTSQGWNPPWGGNAPTWHAANGAFYYGVFWSGMPDVNWRNPEAKAEIMRIARYWLQQGVDGFRLDATRYLVEDGSGPGQADTPETHAALKDLATTVRTTKPSAVLVAENWTTAPIIATYFGDTSTIAGGDEMPMNFDFPIAEAIVAGVNGGNAARITEALTAMQALYPQGVIDAPFLTNHDQRRLASELGNSAPKLRNAAAILLTLPGAPFLYYGEEVGIQNGPTGGDESKRTPMPWTPQGGFTTASPWFQYAPGLSTTNVATQTNDAASLLSRYRNLIRVRKASPALAKGELEMLNGSSQVLAFLRRTGDETVLVVHNVSDGFGAATSMRFNASGFETLFGDITATPSGSGPGAWSVTLPPRTSMIWKVRP
jgi:alpha-amylase